MTFGCTRKTVLPTASAIEPLSSHTSELRVRLPTGEVAWLESSGMRDIVSNPMKRQRVSSVREEEDATDTSRALE